MAERRPFDPSWLLCTVALVACGPRVSDDEANPCEQLLDCLESGAPDRVDATADLYGEDGTCFESSSDDDCFAACEVQLDAEVAAGVCEPDVAGTGDGGTGDGGTGDDGMVPEDGIALSVNRDVDILFVIDNSGSMSEEQESLSRDFAAFLGVLEQEGVEANYRLGVTTTDDGNPVGACDSPEAGSLRLTSCRSRLQEFVFNGTPMVDRQSTCTDYCPEALAELSVTPTSTIDDPEQRPRPWLESANGRTNLPEGVSMTQAFQCFGPQGINGCGFESHLESMYKAIVRTQMASEASFGFLRPAAVTSVVFVTDEADCSVNQEWNDIFLPSGNRVFWSDPDRGGPTSAVCWNAGVSCTPSDAPRSVIESLVERCPRLSPVRVEDSAHRAAFPCPSRVSGARATV